MTMHEQERAYKLGVVLGLTLAEVVILVVFCLLLLFALSFKLSEQSAATPRSWQDSEARRVIDQLETARRPGESWTEFWRRVLIVYKEATAPPPKAPEGPSDSEVARKVVVDMDAKRGGVALDEFWRKTWLASQESEKLKEELRKVRDALAQTEARLKECQSRLHACDLKTARPGHTWPPIIRLREAEGFTFTVGDARLSKDFEAALANAVIPKILKYVEEYGVDIIEVVGHTDEQPVQGRLSTLDLMLLRFLRGETAGALVAADNAGLGIARAASVTRFLMNDPRLQQYHILPLSSAQVLDTTGKLADGKNPGDVRERRRIEIRLRRSDTGASASPN